MIRHLLNTEGVNKGLISGEAIALEVDEATMTKTYTSNGSVKLSAFTSGLINPTVLNENINVEGRLTKRIFDNHFVLSTIALENWITDNNYTKKQTDDLLLNYYTETEVDNLFTNYYTQGEVNTLLTSYATTSYLTTYYYTSSTMNSLFYNKTQSDETFIKINQKGVANGVCPLDNGNKISLSYLPSSIMTYEGLFNAKTNTPILHQPNDNTDYNAGAVFIVQNSIGFDPSTWNDIVLRNGDWLILNASGVWEKSENTDDLIISFNNRVGAVNSIESDYSSFYYTKALTYSKSEIDTNVYTKTYINDNCVFDTGDQTITGVKTFSNNINGKNITLSSTNNSLITALYTGTEHNVNGLTFYNSGTNADPYYYFDFCNSESALLHSFRFAVYKESPTQTQVQFLVSSGDSSLMNYFQMIRNLTNNYINFSVSLTAPNISLTTGIITTAPTENTHIVNKLYCDSKLSKSGGTMTGDILLYRDPLVAMNPVTLQYLQTNYSTNSKFNDYLLLAGGTMTGFLTLNSNPTNNLHAVPLQYLTTNYSTTTANNSTYVNISGTQTITGIKTFSNNVVMNNNLTISTATNGLFTNTYTGTAQAILGAAYQNSGSAIDPFYYFDHSNEEGTDYNKFRYAVYKASSSISQAQFFLSSNASYPLLQYFSLFRGSAGDYIDFIQECRFQKNLIINSVGPSLKTSTNGGSSANMAYYQSTDYVTVGSHLFGDMQIGTTGDDFKMRSSLEKIDSVTTKYSIALSSTGTYGNMLNYISITRKGGNGIPLGNVNKIDLRFYTNLINGGSTIDPYDDLDIVNKRYVDTNFVSTSGLTNYVTLNTNQTISGSKIFSSEANAFTGLSLSLGNNAQFNINATGRLLILMQEDLYLLCQNNNGKVRIGSEGGGSNTGKLIIYRSCEIGLGTAGYRGDTYISNGNFQQWDMDNSICVNRFRNSYPENLYAQLITDYSLNTNGDGRYLRRSAVERNGVNDIRVYDLLSDGTNDLLTFDEVTRIDGNITRYLRNSNVILDKNRVISALNVMPYLSTTSATASGLTAFRWEAQYVKKTANYISYYYRMQNFDEYGYTNYKSVPIKSMTSNSAAFYNRYNYYSFISYGDALNNYGNIRFGISTRPSNLLTNGSTGSLRYGLYVDNVLIPPQINYLTRFWKDGSTWYKGQTNLSSDNFNPIPVAFTESKRYIYTCAWTYDHWSQRRSIIVTTSIIEYETGANLFYDVAYLTNYNNTGRLLDIEEISPMICVTDPVYGVNLEILTNINPDFLSYMIGATDRAAGMNNVFDP